MIIDELPLTDEMVSAYLQDNPDFFTRNSELLTGLRMQDNHRGVVSLVERQQQNLRDKVHLLEEEITQLLAIANNNEQLFTVYSDLYLQLIDCCSLEEILDCLHQTTTKLLSLADCKVWLKTDVNSEHSVLIKENCLTILNTRLADNDYYFGRLQKNEMALIFHHNDIFSCSQIGSVVLIKLKSVDNNLGFIAISSQDAEHFDPRMDTLLLNQFSQLVAKLLIKQL